MSHPILDSFSVGRRKYLLNFFFITSTFLFLDFDLNSI